MAASPRKSAKDTLREEPGQSLRQIPIEDITVKGDLNPRTLFDEAKLKELAESMQETGLLQPIVVRPVKPEDGVEAKYLVVNGERRFRAAKLILNWENIPGIIRTDVEDDGQHRIFAIVENLHREDLDPIEKARAFRSLIEEHKWDNDKIAKKIGLSAPLVSNTIGLLDLPQPVIELIRAKKITQGHGTSLKTMAEAPEEMVQVANLCAQEQWSVKTLRERAKDAMREWRLKQQKPLIQTVEPAPAAPSETVPPPAVETETETPEVTTTEPPAETPEATTTTVPEPETEETETPPISTAKTEEPETVETPAPAPAPSTPPATPPERPAASPTPAPRANVERPSSSRGSLPSTPAPAAAPAESTHTALMVSNETYEWMKAERISPLKLIGLARKQLEVSTPFNDQALARLAEHYQMMPHQLMEYLLRTELDRLQMPHEVEAEVKTEELVSEPIEDTEKAEETTATEAE